MVLAPVYLDRSVWTSAPRPVAKLVSLDPAAVKGVAVHYTGSTSPLGETATLSLSCKRLEDERVFHTSPQPQGRGWSDIAYQAAIDVEGRVFDCRGIQYRSAANGNVPVNMAYGACTWLLGVGDQPTPAMVEAFRDWRETRWLEMYPHATAVVGHRDLYQTDCPGAPTYALVTSGALTHPPEDDVPLTDAEIDAIATHTRDKILAVTYGNNPDGSPHTLGNVLGETLTGVRALQHGSPVTLTADQVQALATAVAGHLPPGADPQVIARAVAAELGRRMAGA